MISRYGRFLSILSILVLAGTAACGTLDQLEDEAGGSGTNSKGSHKGRHGSKEIDTNSIFYRILSDMVLGKHEPIERKEDWKPAHPLSPEESLLVNAPLPQPVVHSVPIDSLPQYMDRRRGDPVLPLCQFEWSHAWLTHSIGQNRFAFEAGSGLAALHMEYRLLDEYGSDPGSLQLVSGYGLLRFLSKSGLEIDLGLGGTEMYGNSEHHGFSVTAPISYDPCPWLLFRWRPAFSWVGGDVLWEHAFTLQVALRYLSIQGGWTGVGSGKVSLWGPTLGVTVTY